MRRFRSSFFAARAPPGCNGGNGNGGKNLVQKQHRKRAIIAWVWGADSYIVDTAHFEC